MNLVEAGVVPGVVAGAIVGAMALGSRGVLPAVGGAAGGLVCGAVIGWMFAVTLMALMAVFAAMWQAALRRPAAPPGDADIAVMSRVAKLGAFAGVLTAAVLWAATSWLHVLIYFLIAAPLLSMFAVARWQMASQNRQPR